MKTKIFFIFLLLVMGVGKGYAQDSIFEKNELNKAFLAHWDSIPGTASEKGLAMTFPEKVVHLEPIIEKKKKSSWNLFLPQMIKKDTIKMAIQFDKKNARFLVYKEIKTRESRELILVWCVSIGIYLFLLVLRVKLFEPHLLVHIVIMLILVATVLLICAITTVTGVVLLVPVMQLIINPK